MYSPLLADLGPWELFIIVAVIVLLFGAKKLPDLARGTGQALRIFKAETKDLISEDKKTDEQRRVEKAQAEADAHVAEARVVEARSETEQERRAEPGA